MTSRATSFRGLKHPLTLASIGLLLLNDHVLKATAPSPLTGKLSDLAGLFFFPFLLAAVLSLPLDRLRVSPRRTATLAFGLTSLWFTLIKTWPWANALTVAALTRLLGPSVQIVLDPTDLLALVVLWPAWRLWIHLERPSPLKPPGKAAYLALGVASLAMLATSCDESSVERVMVFEQSVYADLGYDSIARSDNGGQTWTRIRDFEDMPGQILQQLDRRAQLPIIVCDPENTQTCYRVTGTEQVQGSQDGGQTWKVVWQVPWGRREFIERFAGTQICGTKSDLAPRDLVLLSQEEGAWLFAAMGNEGVLVRTPQGAWRRYGVFAASPTPYRSGDPGVLFWLLFLENGLFLMA
ncbi:MAG: sialidase family protein, partial [Anaerolineae bacterium]